MSEFGGGNGDGDYTFQYINGKKTRQKQKIEALIIVCAFDVGLCTFIDRKTCKKITNNC